jgi:hypothetical protein
MKSMCNRLRNCQNNHEEVEEAINRIERMNCILLTSVLSCKVMMTIESIFNRERTNSSSYKDRCIDR